jgi:hypothetical protein
MATLPAPEERFRIYRNTRNHLAIQVHDRHHNIYYLHRFTSQAELFRYVEQLRERTSERAPDALLAIED